MTEVGCSWGGTRLVRTSNSEKNVQEHWAWAGKQQSKRTQSGSSSQSRHNWGAADEMDAIREHAAAEADAIREQQLKLTLSESSSSAQRPVRRRITHIRERGS